MLKQNPNPPTHYCAFTDKIVAILICRSENTVLEKLSGDVSFWYDRTDDFLCVICYDFVIDVESSATET